MNKKADPFFKFLPYLSHTFAKTLHIKHALCLLLTWEEGTMVSYWSIWETVPMTVYFSFLTLKRSLFLFIISIITLLCSISYLKLLTLKAILKVFPLHNNHVSCRWSWWLEKLFHRGTEREVWWSVWRETGRLWTTLHLWITEHMEDNTSIVYWLVR